MRETYLDLPSRLEDAFPEIDNDIMIELRNENEEHAAFTQYLHLVRQRDDMEPRSYRCGGVSQKNQSDLTARTILMMQRRFVTLKM